MKKSKVQKELQRLETSLGVVNGTSKKRSSTPEFATRGANSSSADKRKKDVNPRYSGIDTNSVHPPNDNSKDYTRLRDGRESPVEEVDYNEEEDDRPFVEHDFEEDVSQRGDHSPEHELPLISNYTIYMFFPLYQFHLFEIK